MDSCQNSEGDHHHAASCLAERAQKTAHSGCRIYRIKWLACSQITCDGKGMHETFCTLQLSLFLDK